MKINHRVFWVVAACAVVLFIVINRSAHYSSSNAKWTIGILQTASHPALDAARDGFIAQVKKELGKDVDFVIRNGQGSINSIYALAQQFHAKSSITGIFAIATPAAQAMISVEKEKPIFIAAVSVSPELGIVFEESNICGASDMINVKAEIKALKALLPDAKIVGIVFSSAETNSVAMSKVMITELEAAGLEPYSVGIASEADMEPAVMSALRKVDVLLAPTDNTVANTITLIADLADRAHKPLIVSDNMLVKYGALMARGVDYYASGVLAGISAVQVLTGSKKPFELPIVQAESKYIYINKQVMEKLGITIPASIKSDVVLVDSE